MWALPGKIISGGQTGVDQAALRAALAAGLPIGGWCPPNRECEDGVIPPEFPLMETDRECSEQAPDVPRSLRTEWNVRDSDGTCIIRTRIIQTRNARMNFDRGTDWTASCAARFGKPLLIVDADDENAAGRITGWMERFDIRALNIAGPSENTAPGIGEQAFGIVSEVISIPRKAKK